ncbi:hypothetical protein K9L27_03485 [Candidatus Gracilibacteria bacterium]|nr:hypothetical protein [Candidatus Gracilibacteria bacterium]
MKFLHHFQSNTERKPFIFENNIIPPKDEQSEAIDSETQERGNLDKKTKLDLKTLRIDVMKDENDKEKNVITAIEVNPDGEGKTKLGTDETLIRLKFNNSKEYDYAVTDDGKMEWFNPKTKDFQAEETLKIDLEQNAIVKNNKKIDINDVSAVPDALNVYVPPISPLPGIKGYDQLGLAVGVTLEEFKQKFIKQVQADIQTVKSKKASETLKEGGFLGFGGAPDTELWRLEETFPEAFKSKESNFDLITQKLDSPDMNWASLYDTLKPLDETDAGHVTRLEQLKNSIPNNAWEPEDGEALSPAEKYMQAVKWGYKYEFERWDDNQPRSGGQEAWHTAKNVMKAIWKSFGGMIESVLKLVGIELPDFAKSLFGKSDLSPEAKALKDKYNQEIQGKKNGLEWKKEENKDVLKAFDVFRNGKEKKEGYKNFFSFLDGTDQDYQISVSDFQTWRETKLFDATTNISAVLDYFQKKPQMAEGISIDEWKSIVNHAKNMKIENGKLFLRAAEDQEFVEYTGTWKEFSTKITEIQSTAETEIGQLVSDVEGVKEYVGKFVEDVRIPDKLTNADALKTFQSFLKLDDKFWTKGNTKLTQRDVDMFSKYTGSKLFDKSDDVFHKIEENDEEYYVLENGKLRIEKEGKDSFEVDGSATYGMFSSDKNFSSIEAFLEWLYVDGKEEKASGIRAAENKHLKNNVKIPDSFFVSTKPNDWSGNTTINSGLLFLLNLPEKYWQGGYQLDSKEIKLLGKSLVTSDTLKIDNDNLVIEREFLRENKKFRTVQEFFQWLDRGGKDEAVNSSPNTEAEKKEETKPEKTNS